MVFPLICTRCGEPIEEVATIDAAGDWYHSDCWKRGLFEYVHDLESALRPFAECWVSSEPRLLLDQDYRKAAEVLERWVENYDD